jgi:hypothetical protein
LERRQSIKPDENLARGPHIVSCHLLSNKRSGMGDRITLLKESIASRIIRNGREVRQGRQA